MVENQRTLIRNVWRLWLESAIMEKGKHKEIKKWLLKNGVGREEWKWDKENISDFLAMWSFEMLQLGK